ncbi:DUF3592 domain-containing protein [Streptacidiphilus sp. ASG 303]|nr:DUF3592 domain-containing protein [Streptacidiphilus sp. ASG 303]
MVAGEIRAYSFSHRAVPVTAMVDEVRHHGRNTDYLVSFRLADGSTGRGWISLPNEYQVGDSVPVLYDRHDPTDIQDSKSLDAGIWFDVIIFLPLGGLLLWCSRRAWRADPAKWRLRSR